MNAVHFVGFRGEELHSAEAVWGKADFFHRKWDMRAAQEVAEGDVVIFARYRPPSVDLVAALFGGPVHSGYVAFGAEVDPGHPPTPSLYCYDDSNQADDPASQER
jgi:hypothetical protein